MTPDLAPPNSGLLPAWSVVLGVALVACALLAAARLRPRRPGLLSEVGAIVALLLAQLLFFWRPLLTTAEIPNGGGDLASYTFPLHAFAAQQLQSGHFPLWDPYLKGGMPQLANLQAGMLYPINLLGWLLARPFSYGALELMAISQYLIASLGAYALARTLAMRRLPALLAGVVFAYSGFLVAHLGHYQMVSTAVWLPLLLLTVRRLALTRSWLWAVAFGLVVFLATAAGHQPALLYDLTAAGVWWLFWAGEREGLWLNGLEGSWRLARERAAVLAGTALRFVAALALGLALAAPVVIPSFQLSALSVRSSITYDQSTEYSAEPVVLLHFILPKVFGSNATDPWGSFASAEVWGYVGVVTLLLAGLALALRPTRVRLFLAGLAALALLYALGPFTPVEGWVYRFVPLYDLVRAPARGYLILDLCLALLAAFGLQELLDLLDGAWETPRAREVLRLSLRGLLIVLGALTLFILPLFYSLVFDARDAYNRPVIVVDGLNVLLLILAAFTVLLWAIARRRLSGRTAGSLMLALATLDLFSATAGFNPAPADVTAGFRHPQAVQFLRQQLAQAGPFRIEGSTAGWQPDLAAVVGFDDIGGLFDPMQPKRYDVAVTTVTQNRALPFYDLFGVRYLITDDKAASPGAKFHSVLHTQDGLVLWQNDQALPRAWLSGRAQPARTAGSALSAALSPSFDPRATLYLSGPGSDAKPDPSTSGNARITLDAADSVSVAVEANAPAELVLADVNYPGWVATVDGKSVPVSTADGLFRAVAVPAGAHQVVFRFQPPLLTLSLAVALAGAVAGAVMLVLGFRQRARRGVSHLDLVLPNARQGERDEAVQSAIEKG